MGEPDPYVVQDGRIESLRRATVSNHKTYLWVRPFILSIEYQVATSFKKGIRDYLTLRTEDKKNQFLNIEKEKFADLTSHYRLKRQSRNIFFHYRARRFLRLCPWTCRPSGS